jgi:hypothetical protein
VTADAGTSITAWAVFSALGGSIVGSIVGGVIAYWLQNKSLAATKAQHDDDRFNIRRAQAYSLFVKMIKIHSSIVLLGRSIKEDTAKAAKLNKQPWQMVLPLGTLPDRVRFLSDEVALLLGLDNSLFNEIGPFDEIQSSLIGMFDTYRIKRAEMMQPFGADMEGAMGTMRMTPDQHRWMAPREFELNQLIEAMVQRTEQDGNESWELIKRLHALLKKEFKLDAPIAQKSAV